MPGGPAEMTKPNAVTRGFSFEFFPPKTDKGRKRLARTLKNLAPLKPAFVSVTFGAGGSTREGSFQTTTEIIRTSSLNVTPHLSCIAASEGEIRAQLETYQKVGVKRVVALRGDLPEGFEASDQSFEHANELVEFIKGFGGFHISVACYPEFHPEAASPQIDLENFVRKVRCGADEAITQYFFNNDAYYSFVDSVRAMGVDIPIVPGLMPITDFQQVVRFSSFCGADIPLWIRKRMEAYADDPPSQKALGIEIATRQAEDLLRNGVGGIHFYTLNKSGPTLRIWENLGLSHLGGPQPLSPTASN